MVKHHKCPRCKYIYENNNNNNNNNNKIRTWLIIISIITIILLLIGVLGYHIFDNKNWIDSLYDATSVMSGVGAAETPVYLETKIFVSFYNFATNLLYIIILTVVIGLFLSESQ